MPQCFYSNDLDGWVPIVPGPQEGDREGMLSRAQVEKRFHPFQPRGPAAEGWAQDKGDIEVEDTITSLINWLEIITSPPTTLAGDGLDAHVHTMGRRTKARNDALTWLRA